MKDNQFETVAQMVGERVSGMADYLSSANKKQKPFGVEEKEPVDRLYIYDQLRDETKIALVQKHGLVAWQAFERDVQRIKKARGLM